MHQLPPLPEWSNFHPLLTHFPIVLLLLLPILLILAGWYRGTRNHMFWAASLVTLLAGLALLWVTFLSGVAFAHPAPGLPAIASIIAHHCSLAQYTIGAFSMATVLLAIGLAVRKSLRLEDMRDLSPWIPVGFFTFYGFGVFWLVLTAHQGAILAHELIPGAAR
jgi:uncharacterized membrane protein